jgi:DTW domain-containing protein YfiP
MDTTLIYQVFLSMKEMLLAQLSVSKAESTQIFFRETGSNCPYCWLQPQSHCICSKCTPISHKPSKLNRIFLLMHYKELMIKVDNTAKLLWAHFPETILAVSGILSKLLLKQLIPATCLCVNQTTLWLW